MNDPRNGDCSAVLVPEVSIIDATTSTQLAWFSLKKSLKVDRSNTVVDANVGLLDWFKAGVDTNHESEQIENLLRESRFAFDQSEAFNILSMGLNDAQINGWVECIKNNRFYGPLLIARDNDPKYPLVQFHYVVPEGIGAPSVNISVSGTYASIEGVTHRFVGTSKQAWLIERKEDEHGVLQDVSLIVNASVDGGVLSDTLKLPYFAPVPIIIRSDRTIVGQWVYVNVRTDAHRTIGHTEDDETGMLIAEGKFTVWRHRRWLRPKDSATLGSGGLRVRVSKEGKKKFDVSYSGSGISVPSGCDVDVYFADSNHRDNSAHPTDPLRVKLVRKKV